MRNSLFPLTFFILLPMLLLGACATTPPDPETQEASTVASAVGDSAIPDLSPSASGSPPIRLTATPLPTPMAAEMDQNQGIAALTPRTGLILPGTGNFIGKKNASNKSAPVVQTAQGEVTLNFEGADIRDVIKVIFETLKENYTVDPQVQGEVTVQTSRPLARETLLPTLETLLRMNNAVLVREGGMNKILPAAGAVRQSGLTPRLSGGVGYGIRIVPLRYVSAAEMQTIVAPFLPEGGVVRADVLRNLLILAGTPQELDSVQGTIDAFDVNWLKGMSIGMFRLRNVDSQAMATNLNQLLGEGSGTPIAGLLRFVPLSKLNAVLAITPQAEYLKDVATWIERLDGVGGERLYVYQVQNSRADYVAELLNGLFNLGSGGGSNRGGDLAPGLKSTQLSSGPAGSAGLTGGSNASTLGASSSSSAASSAGNSRSGGKQGAGEAMGSSGPSAGMEEVRIVADTENNSLLIWATSQNYERIVSVLQKMDVAPRQVLIEATIAEVTLTGNLKYGVQWFFNNDIGNSHKGNGSLGLTNNLSLTNALEDIPSGQFSYAITNSAGAVKALLSTLASDSKVKVLSSPQVMVVDNQQAVIRIGTQQPISSGTTTVNNVTTSGGVTYKDTGVLLDVLPRVSSGGMVNMEIKQEVVDVGSVDSATSQRSFLQRSVTSKVAVKSGQTIVLGGLIRDNRTDGQSGIPVLYKIPVLGALFGNTEEQVDRTELIVLITPRVVLNSQETDQITDEIKRKMREVAPLLKKSAS